jgi:tetratricopeptide (TPR) repeat protein
MNNLAMVCLDAGQLDQAIPVFEETLKLQRAVQGVQLSDMLVTMNNLGAAYNGAGKFDQAISLCEEAFNLAKAKLEPEHWMTRMIGKKAAYAHGALRHILMERRDFEQLDALLPRHVAHVLALLPSNDPDFAGEVARLALDLLHREKFLEAEPLARESFAIREKKAPDDWRRGHAHPECRRPKRLARGQ